MYRYMHIHIFVHVHIGGLPPGRPGAPRWQGSTANIYTYTPSLITLRIIGF